MKKYYFVGTNPRKEAKVCMTLTTLLRNGRETEHTLTEEALKRLMSLGLIKYEEITEDPKIEPKKGFKVPLDARYYIANFGKRQGWNFESTIKNLDSIGNIYPISAFILILREIAVELDKQYPDHINNCKEVYILDTLNGKIRKVFTANIRNFKNFAAFRTEEDAKIACSILRNQIKLMFSSPKHGK